MESVEQGGDMICDSPLLLADSASWGRAGWLSTQIHKQMRNEGPRRRDECRGV